jgi:hypothetical protein
MKQLLRTTVFTLAILAAPSFAQTPSGLVVQSDLILHPTQMVQFFALSTAQLNATQSWSLANISMTQPYNTTWSQVTAQGPFQIVFDTSTLATNEFSFTLTWANPAFTVGAFALNDTIHTTVSGNNVTLNLSYACSNLAISVPSANWVIQGKMRYDLSSGAFVPSWENFTFQASGSPAQVNMGQCQGPPTFLPTIQGAIATAAGSQSLWQSMLQPAVLSWVQSSLTSLQGQLLAAHAAQLQSDLTLTWQPAQLSALSGGLIRVAGSFLLNKAGSAIGVTNLARNYAVSGLSAVTESSFILPKNTLQYVLNYMYSNGELLYRTDSTQIPAFQSLESSWFEKFFVWPDLFNFASNALFYFDVTTSAAPQLGSGWMLQGGGSAYSVTAPLLVHQWAPAGSQFLPYVDFMAPVTGQLSAVIKSGQLNLQLNTGSLNITDGFRTEYAKVRMPNASINTGVMSSSVATYLNSTPYSVAMPTWAISPSLSLEMTDLQVWTQSFRIPLGFVSH